MMITLRCTRKMLKVFGGPEDEPLEPVTNALGDWYVKRVSLPGRTSVVLFVSEPSRLAVLVPGRGSKTTVQQFRERATRLLRRLDLPDAAVTQEAAAMERTQLAPTASRSVLGSMNEIGWYLIASAEQRGGFSRFDLEEAERYLTTYLHGPLDYRRPAKIARELLEERWGEAG